MFPGCYRTVIGADWPLFMVSAQYHFGSRMDAGGIMWYTYYHHQDHAQVQKFLIIVREQCIQDSFYINLITCSLVL